MSAAPTDLLKNYLKQEPLRPQYDYRDLEEAALREVINLFSSTVEPIIAQIESYYQTTKKMAEASYRETKEELDKNYKAATDQIQRDCQQQIDKIRQEYDAQKQDLKTRTKGEKEKAADNTESELAHSKENYEYEIMVADIVEKGSLKKYQTNMAGLQESVSAAKSELNHLLKNAEQILSQYKISIHDKADNVPQANRAVKHDPMEFYRQQKQIASVHLHVLSGLLLPKVFLTAARYVIALFICLIFAFAVWLISRNMPWNASELAMILGGGLFILITILFFFGRLLRKKALSQVMHNFNIIDNVLAAANVVLDEYLRNSLEQLEKNILEAKDKCRHEKQAAAEKYDKLKSSMEQQNQAAIKNAAKQFNQVHGELENRFSSQIAQFEQQRDDQQKACTLEYDEKIKQLHEHFSQNISQIENEHNSIWQQLKKSWFDRLHIIKTMLAETQKLDRSLFCDWQNSAWTQWQPEKKLQHLIRFGTIELDLQQIAQPVRELMDADLQGHHTVILPAVLAFPNRCSLFVQAAHKAKDSAISLIKAVMARLFVSEPAGQVHFNIFDPIGLGKNFVGFMHAVDYEKTLVGGRIWTDGEHIQRCLAELTTHMENVIQKYLRNEFETIEAYNLQAGELAEPYRFLVIADFPANFSDDSIRRLGSIISSGPRCGVYTLIISDESQKLPEGISLQDLASNGVHLIRQKDQFIWQNEVLKRFPLKPDSSPSEELLTDLVRKVGIASIDSTRVEVPFDTIAPSETEQWSQDSTFDIRVAIGRSGAKRLQYLQLGKGVNQHMLIAGKTGSGKSTLFHIIIGNLALWYSPDEIELYLIDFKQGVEFKTYAVHKLPHARAVAIESDREFGLSILQRLDAEMTARGEKFRQVRVQDIASYRQTTGQKMPRTVLIIDEFQILFADDDKIAHDSTMLLEKLVRQGRAFGIHIILGSQSLAGISGISRSIMGQMAVRIALQCSEMDAQIIFNEDNVVARLLSRPGEAIYNDAGGMVVGNNPFQVAWLAKTTQDEYLSNVSKISKKLVLTHEPMIVFEGNIPADVANNPILAGLIQNPFSNTNPAKEPPRAWLGEPVTIKSPTAAVFGRQNGANLLVIGQQDFAITGIFSSALLSLLIQLSPQAGEFIIAEGGPADSLLNTKLRKIDSLIGHKCRFFRAAQAAEIIGELALEIQSRLEGNSDSQTKFLFIPGLQHYRMLYRKEDDWSVSSDEKAASIDKQFANILREGPSVGIHVIAGTDTFTTIDRVLDRQTLREFNNRVLFQMSASDSSNLIDSPIANQLGFQRALFYNEEQGVLEKFRFYAPPDEHWLKQVADKLAGRS